MRRVTAVTLATTALRGGRECLVQRVRRQPLHVAVAPKCRRAKARLDRVQPAFDLVATVIFPASATYVTSPWLRTSRTFSHSRFVGALTRFGRRLPVTGSRGESPVAYHETLRLLPIPLMYAFGACRALLFTIGALTTFNSLRSPKCDAFGSARSWVNTRTISRQRMSLVPLMVARLAATYRTSRICPHPGIDRQCGPLCQQLRTWVEDNRWESTRTSA